MRRRRHLIEPTSGWLRRWPNAVVGRASRAADARREPGRRDAGRPGGGRCATRGHQRATGAQLALMNPGGLRATLAGDANGLVRYEDLFAVQPFYNNLVTHHAHRRATAARARAAVAEPAAAARAAGVARLHLQLGRRQAGGRTHRAGQPAPERRRHRAASSSCASRSTASWPAAATTSPCSSRTARSARTGMMDIDALERYVARTRLDRTGLARAHPTRELSLAQHRRRERRRSFAPSARARRSTSAQIDAFVRGLAIAQLERGPGRRRWRWRSACAA